MDNYLKNIKKQLEENNFRPGSIIFIDVFHDKYCNYLKGEQCNCRPETITTKIETAEGLTRFIKERKNLEQN